MGHNLTTMNVNEPLWTFSQLLFNQRTTGCFIHYQQAKHFINTNNVSLTVLGFLFLSVVEKEMNGQKRRCCFFLSIIFFF